MGMLKLGFTVAQSTVARYMAKKGGGPSSGQNWSTFLRNHMPHIAAIDLFVVPTIGFRLLYRPSDCSAGPERARPCTHELGGVTHRVGVRFALWGLTF